MRPRPVITEQLVKSDSFFSAHLHRTHDSFLASSGAELWINIQNNGRTPIRNMRARAKIQVMSDSYLAKSPQEVIPVGVSVQEWEEYRGKIERMRSQVVSDLFFGTALPLTKGTPFARTPRGTIAMPWETVADLGEYVIDLAPRSDEASVRIALVCKIEAKAKRQIEKAFGPHRKIGKESDTIVQIGTSLPAFVASHVQSYGQSPFDVAIKFWVIADNLTTDKSEIIHVLIPESLDTIVYSSIAKNTKEYAELDKLFQVRSLI